MTRTLFAAAALVVVTALAACGQAPQGSAAAPAAPATLPAPSQPAPAQPAPAPTSGPTQLTITLGEEYLVANLAPLPGQPAVSRDAAVTAARDHVDSWQQAKAVVPQYVALSLHSTDGSLTPGFDKRPVWLVTFNGAEYNPPSLCACAIQYVKASTAVAMDPASGAFVTEFGVD